MARPLLLAAMSSAVRERSLGRRRDLLAYAAAAR